MQGFIPRFTPLQREDVPLKKRIEMTEIQIQKLPDVVSTAGVVPTGITAWGQSDEFAFMAWDP